MDKLQLYIGDKHLSSWSMRPWLLMKHFEIPFDEHLIKLDQADTKTKLGKISPSGKVPFLVDRDTTVWDSLSIIEYLAEKFPRLNIWPEPSKLRAEARSACAEMHSGFLNLRKQCSMSVVEKKTFTMTLELQADIDRIDKMWSEIRQQTALRGHCLFGAFSAADAFFMPVVSRFITYGIQLREPKSAQYLLDTSSGSLFKMWVSEAKKDL